MIVDEMIKLVECCAKNGVSELKVDKFRVTFQNIKLEEKKSDIPSPNYPDIPNPEIEEEEDYKSGDFNLYKAEELALMAVENPEKFEEMLANDDELLKEFEKELSED